jgi:GYF domain 2/zinc-ribbon domain
MADALWYYEEAGKPAGPVTAAALLGLIRAGRLGPGARVWRSGLASWLPWEKVPELQPAPVPPPPPPPVPPPAPSWSAPSQPGPAPAPPPGPPPAWSAAPSPGSGWSAPPPAPQPWGVAPPPLIRTEVPQTIGLSLVTCGIFGIVRFYQAARGYLQLTPGRASRFEPLFWSWLATAVFGSLLTLPHGAGWLGHLVQLASVPVGAFLLSDVLSARAAAAAARGSRVALTAPAQLITLWVLGEASVLTFGHEGGLSGLLWLVSFVFTLIQAIQFFSDHDKLAVELQGGPAAARGPLGPPPSWPPAPAPQGAPPATPPAGQVASPPSGRFCANCGTALAPGARFCPACGRGV